MGIMGHGKLFFLFFLILLISSSFVLGDWVYSINNYDSDYCANGVCAGNLTADNISSVYGIFDWVCLTSDNCIPMWPLGGAGSFALTVNDNSTDILGTNGSDVWYDSQNANDTTQYIIDKNYHDNSTDNINMIIYPILWSATTGNNTMVNNSMIDFVVPTNDSMRLYVDDKISGVTGEDFTDEIIGNYSAGQGNIVDNSSMLQLAMTANKTEIYDNSDWNTTTSAIINESYHDNTTSEMQAAINPLLLDINNSLGAGNSTESIQAVIANTMSAGDNSSCYLYTNGTYYWFDGQCNNNTIWNLIGQNNASNGYIENYNVTAYGDAYNVTAYGDAYNVTAYGDDYNISDTNLFTSGYNVSYEAIITSLLNSIDTFFTNNNTFTFNSIDTFFTNNNTWWANSIDTWFTNNNTAILTSMDTFFLNNYTAAITYAQTALTDNMTLVNTYDTNNATSILTSMDAYDLNNQTAARAAPNNFNIDAGNLTFAGATGVSGNTNSYAIGNDTGLSVPTSKPAFCNVGAKITCLIFQPGLASYNFTDTNLKSAFLLRLDGNITMYASNNTAANCGVVQSGDGMVFDCSPAGD